MPQSSHERVAEFHNLAAHAHSAAAAAHGKGDHLTAHELSKQAHEHSMNAHKLSEELAAQHAHPGMRHDTTAVGRHFHPRPDRDTLHLRSAFPLERLNPREVQFSLAGQALSPFKPRVTPSFAQNPG